MATKDVSMKMLVRHNDVFADIVNVLLFGGEQVVKTEDLTDAPALSLFKSDKMRWQERDMVKHWTVGGVNIAIYGIENQSSIDPYMPLRVMSYDGAFYRQQLNDMAGTKPCPVITLVLYYGYDREWIRPLSLYQCFDVPEKLRPYVKDYEINVFNIAYLDEETRAKFKSDFRFVAELYEQKRTKCEYKLSDERITYAEDLLSALSALTGDRRYIECFEPEMKEREVFMCEFVDALINEGMAIGEKKGLAIGKKEGLAIGEKKGLAIGEKKGLAIGEKKGLAIGEKKGLAIGEKKGLAIGEKNMSNIILYLMKNNRLDDLQRIAKDAKHLEAIREEMKNTEC